MQAPVKAGVQAWVLMEGRGTHVLPTPRSHAPSCHRQSLSSLLCICWVSPFLAPCRGPDGVLRAQGRECVCAGGGGYVGGEGQSTASLLSMGSRLWICL